MALNKTSSNSALSVAHQQLYRSIVNFSIDEGEPELTFAERLGRENGWPLHYAERVIGEYQKFIFLVMVTEHSCTPSDQVDQAWHLHLTYTRSYWERFCGEVLGRPIHHGPTRGGQVEGEKYQDWYIKTLESYQLVFEEAPPADIWPDKSIRFGDTLYFQRVNSRHHWILSKWSTKRFLFRTLLLLITVFGLYLATSEFFSF